MVLQLPARKKNKGYATQTRGDEWDVYGKAMKQYANVTYKIKN